ncbi:lipase family protein [Streptococcus agalactiae]|uniref:lipase family protein n=1 Tax=Streptococcus agalactiae TaxID=1311 RepID=UPI00376F0302
MSEYKTIHPNARLKDQYDNTIGVVSEVYDNTSHSGEQIYAVVDNRHIPKEDVKEVTVLFRGSTSPQEFINNPADVTLDWLENDIPMASNIWVMKDFGNPHNFSAVSPQLKASSEHLKEIMKKYPNAKINIGGHSLGGMDAQYAVVDITVTKGQKKTADSLKSKIVVYVDPNDFIGMVGREGKKGSEDSVGTVYYTESPDINWIDQHMTYGYRMENGQIKVIETNLPPEVRTTRKAMGSFYKDKKKFKKSGKGLSSHEKIFLDAEQAAVIASGLVSTAETALEDIKTSAKTAVGEAEELWNTTKSIPFGITELTEAELAEAYAEGGVTYDSIVTKTDTHFDEKVKNAGDLVTTYTTLKSDIQSGVETMLSKDSELAGDFKAWEN